MTKNRNKNWERGYMNYSYGIRMRKTLYNNHVNR